MDENIIKSKIDRLVKNLILLYNCEVAYLTNALVFLFLFVFICLDLSDEQIKNNFIITYSFITMAFW